MANAMAGMLVMKNHICSIEEKTQTLGYHNPTDQIKPALVICMAEHITKGESNLTHMSAIGARRIAMHCSGEGPEKS